MTSYCLLLTSLLVITGAWSKYIVFRFIGGAEHTSRFRFDNASDAVDWIIHSGMNTYKIEIHTSNKRRAICFSRTQIEGWGQFPVSKRDLDFHSEFNSSVTKGGTQKLSKIIYVKLWEHTWPDHSLESSWGARSDGTIKFIDSTIFPNFLKISKKRVNCLI
jgi:hypothetical protein